MLFNSFEFLVFFGIVVLAYYFVPHRYRWALLLAASYFFYMNWNPAYSLLMLFSSFITYFSGILIEGDERRHMRRIYLAICLVINFGILLFFKYFNFLNESIATLFDSWGIPWRVSSLNILLPVGISFYTFQAVGYTIDVYRREISAERHFGIYALFVSFFPQLVAGPIERAKNLLPQFRIKHTLNLEHISSGLRWMLWGMFVKIVIADRAALYVDAVYNNSGSHSGESMSLATFLFALQIYCDFSGYSMIALGAARVLGFELMQNFRRPYLAATMADFWRRWHISLSTWFKDYLYFPLGGNRVGRLRNYFNLLVTFLVSGLWHGANWTFVVWGAIHGTFQIVERAVLPPISSGATRIFRYALTMFAVLLGWVFFRAATVEEGLYIAKKVLIGWNGSLFIDKTTFFYLAISVPVLVVVDLLNEYRPALLRDIVHSPLRLAGYVGLIVWIMLFGVFNGGQFIYFQF